MRPLPPSRLAWLACLCLAGCAPHRKAAAPATPEPASSEQQIAPPPCATTGTDGSAACPTSPALVATRQLQEALHDLRRLGLVTSAVEVGHGRVALTLGDQGVAQDTPLAYHLERLYRAYRTAYDLGDIVALELWRDGREIGSYSSQGLLLR